MPLVPLMAVCSTAFTMCAGFTQPHHTRIPMVDGLVQRSLRKKVLCGQAREHPLVPPPPRAYSHMSLLEQRGNVCIVPLRLGPHWIGFLGLL